jgi:hypothetical protein
MGEVAQAWDAQGNPIAPAAPAAKQTWDASGKPITAAPPTPTPGFFKSLQNSFDTNTQTSPTEPLLETGLKRVVGAVGGPLVHPLDTLMSIPHMADIGPSNPLVQRAGEAKEDYQAGGLPYAGTKLAGDALGTYLGGKITEGGIDAARAVPSIVRSGANVIAGTTPKVAGDLAETTAADNAAAQAKADTANTNLQTQRSADLQKHFERTQAIRAQNEAAEAAQSRKVALNRGVEQLDPKFKEDLSTLRDNVQGKANQMFGDLNAKLDPVEADPSFLPTALESAAEKIKGSNTEPTILRDMEKRLNNTGEPLTYRDLQGYYSELGRELSKGTLPGDVYHAYDTLQEAVSGEMQRIADANGVGDALTSARQYYRQMKQTFFDPKSPVTKALNTTEAGQAVKALQGKDQTGIGAIAQYDPELAKRANAVRGYQAEAKSIPARAVTPKPEPTLSPAKPPVLADVKKIGLGDIRQAKADSMADRAKAATTGAAAKITSGAMSGIAAFDFMRNLLHGNLKGAGVDLAARGGLAATQYVYGKMLQSPAVIRLLTAPTPADIAAIPPDLRANMPQLAKAAEARGIKVHPIFLLPGAVQPQPTQ